MGSLPCSAITLTPTHDLAPQYDNNMVSQQSEQTRVPWQPSGGEAARERQGRLETALHLAPISLLDCHAFLAFEPFTLLFPLKKLEFFWIRVMVDWSTDPSVLSLSDLCWRRTSSSAASYPPLPFDTSLSSE